MASSLPTGARGLYRGIEGAARSPWVERFARLGLVVKATLYFLIGLLSVQTALGEGHSVPGHEGAIHRIAAQPLGHVLLLLLTVGLGAYSLWRFVSAIFDTEAQGTSPKGLLMRGGYLISGFTYAGLTAYAYQLASGHGGGHEDLASKLFALPFGPALVGLVGLVLIGVAFVHAKEALTAGFCKKLDLSRMSDGERKAATLAGRIGLGAHATTFVLIGLFLLHAAVTVDPSKAGGIDGALQALARQPFGPVLLGVVAAGLVVYSVYLLFLARYRRAPAR